MESRSLDFFDGADQATQTPGITLLYLGARAAVNIGRQTYRALVFPFIFPLICVQAGRLARQRYRSNSDHTGQ